MEDTGPGPVPISASKSSKFSWVFAFFWFSSIDLICLLRTRGSWWGESCERKNVSHNWNLYFKQNHRHGHLFDGEGNGVADLGQGVDAALVRPRVPGLCRADHQRPVIRSDSRPEIILPKYFVLKSHYRWLWACLCDLQSDGLIRAILKTTSTYFCKSIEISKKFAKHLGFPLFVEIKFSRFNLTWRTAAKEVNLQHALQDKLFIVGQQSSEKCARFSSSGCYLRNPPHPTTLLSEVIVWKFRPAHTVYISVWHCQHFLRLPC